MAQKRSAKAHTTKRTTRRKSSKKKGGFNLGKFTLGMVILLVLGYSSLAIWEGKLVIDEVSEFEFPEFMEDLEDIDLSTEPSNPTEEAQDEEAPSDNSGNSNDTGASFNRFEDFDAEGFDLYFTKAFDFAWPEYSTNETIIERPYYTLRYNETHEQAMWVAYKLVADSLDQDKFERKNDFREDPRVKTASASLADYKGSGFDRGHLAPAGDFSYDDFALSQSFYMSNMSPQDPSFNRGIWRKLEEKVRDCAMEDGEVYVVTGPVLTNSLPSIGENKVSVPKHYYKIILDVRKPEIKAIAFLLQNEGSSKPLSAYVVSIDQIERLTSLDFFPTIPDELEAYLESGASNADWEY